MMDAYAAPPAELAVWARAAAATVLEKPAPILPVESARVTFPERRDQRMLARLRERDAGRGGGLALAAERPLVGEHPQRAVEAGRRRTPCTCSARRA
jgi:hypothetical protein